MYTRRTFLGTFTAAFFGLGSYAFAFEPLYRLVVTRYDLALPLWPANAKPLTVALIADIHAVDPWMTADRIAEIVATTNALKPDLTLLLGDYVGSTRVQKRYLEPQEWAEPLALLRAPLGVHAILGNHDYLWRDGVEPVRRALERVGIAVYENQATKIDADGHRFWLGGTASIHTGPQQGFPRGPGMWGSRENFRAMRTQITDDAPIIHMAHEPDLWLRTRDGVALTLSGHTHGGQVVVPFFGRVLVPSAYGQRFAYGHIQEGDQHLIVSGGLGCSKLPVRFGVPPEIVLLSIRSGLTTTGRLSICT